MCEVLGVLKLIQFSLASHICYVQQHKLMHTAIVRRSWMDWIWIIELWIFCLKLFSFKDILQTYFTDIF